MTSKTNLKASFNPQRWRKKKIRILKKKRRSLWCSLEKKVGIFRIINPIDIVFCFFFNRSTWSCNIGHYHLICCIIELNDSSSNLLFSLSTISDSLLERNQKRGKEKKTHKRCNKTKPSLRKEQFIVLTSQCQPPSPTAFLTTPWRPTRTDFVRLFPVTTTFVCRGNTVNSSSLLQSPKQLCNWDNPPLRTFELSTASSICFFLFSSFSSVYYRNHQLEFSRSLKRKLVHFWGRIEKRDRAKKIRVFLIFGLRKEDRVRE